MILREIHMRLEILIDRPETLEHHALTCVWPPPTSDQVRELAADIRRRGLLEPIPLFEGRVLDGRRRLAACLLAQVVPRFVEYDGADPLGDVFSCHLYRHALGSPARALAAAQLARLSLDSPETWQKWSVASAARAVGMAAAEVKKAAAVLARGADELIALVGRGEVKTDAALRVVQELSPADQAALVRRGGKKAVVALAASLKVEEKERRVRVVKDHGPSRFAQKLPPAPLPPRIEKVAKLLTRLSSELTTLLQQPEGVRFVEYVAKLKLGWIRHSAQCVVTKDDGRQEIMPPKFIGLIPLRRLLVAAARDKRYSKKQLEEQVLRDQCENPLDGTTVPAEEPVTHVMPEIPNKAE